MRTMRLGSPNAERRWYVIRDIGAALGETGRVGPTRDNAGLFERIRFNTRTKEEIVEGQALTP